MKLWNVDTGREILSLGRHEKKVYAVALSPDGKRIASGGRTTPSKFGASSKAAATPKNSVNFPVTSPAPCFSKGWTQNCFGRQVAPRKEARECKNISVVGRPPARKLWRAARAVVHALGRGWRANTPAVFPAKDQDHTKVESKVLKRISLLQQARHNAIAAYLRSL